MKKHLNIMVLYVVAMFMVAIDGTIMNVILPTIAIDFNVLANDTNGINVSYLSSIAISLPAAGYLANRFGVKKIFLIAVFVFTLASFLCGIASTLTGLIAARVLQGLAGGIITPVSMALLFRTFSPEERQKLSRSLVLPIAFAPAIGPLAGGLLEEYLSWQWAFFINIPFGIFVVVLGYFTLNEFELFKSKFDLKGYIYVAIGLPIFMMTLSLIASEGVTPKAMILGLIGLVLLIQFYRYEKKITDPLLEIRLYEDRLFCSLSFVAMCSMGALMGMLYLFPLMYQYTYSASALESSLIVFTEALGLMAASRILPITSKRFGMRVVIQAGLIGTIIVFANIITLGPTANPWILRSLMFCMGVFLGQTVIGSQISAFNHVTGMNMSKATTLYNMLNRVGAASGIAIVATILSIALQVVDSTMAYQIALFGTIGLLLIGLTFTLSVKAESFTFNQKKEISENKA
jgi:EmrB/QacA subfamily drug resistance transporter